MVSFVAIPRAQQAIAAAVHDREPSRARIAQYSVSMNHIPISDSARWITYVTAPVSSGWTVQSSATASASPAAEAPTRGCIACVRNVRRSTPNSASAVVR